MIKSLVNKFKFTLLLIVSIFLYSCGDNAIENSIIPEENPFHRPSATFTENDNYNVDNVISQREQHRYLREITELPIEANDASAFSTFNQSETNPFGQWDENKVYATPGNRVSYDTGSETLYFENKWWTRGDAPYPIEQYGPWREVVISNTPPTEGNEPPAGGGESETPEQDIPVVEVPPDGKIAKWNANSVYLGSDRAYHQGNVYEAKWWTRGNEPVESPTPAWSSPWKKIGVAGGEEGGVVDDIVDDNNGGSDDVVQGDVCTDTTDTTLNPIFCDNNDNINTDDDLADSIIDTETDEVITEPVIPEPPPEIEPAPPIDAETELPVDGYVLLRSLDSNDWDWFFPLRYGRITSGSTFNTNSFTCVTFNENGEGQDTVNTHGECDQYTLGNFIKATLIYNAYAQRNNLPQFLNDGTIKQQAEELATILANMSRETSGSWSTASSPWIVDDAIIGMKVWKGGLYWIEEVGHSTDTEGKSSSQHYVDYGSAYNPVEGRSYHGRGPIQLSWNYNYGQFSHWLYDNGMYPEVIKERNILLKNPGLVNKDAVIAFLSAIWFNMTPQGAKPSIHDVLLGKVTNVSRSSQDQGLPQRNDGVGYPSSAEINYISSGSTTDPLVQAFRFGTAINIINGGLECNRASSWHNAPAERVSYYEAYATYINSQTNAGATTLGLGHIAQGSDRKVNGDDVEIKRLATCFSMKSYYGW